MGTPRTAMFVFPSPPEDSERIPGILRNISAVVRGVDCSILLGFKVVMLTLDLSLLALLVTPVMTISSSPARSVLSRFDPSLFWPNAENTGRPKAHKVPIKCLVVLFMPKMFEVIKCYGDTILREQLQHCNWLGPCKRLRECLQLITFLSTLSLSNETHDHKGYFKGAKPFYFNGFKGPFKSS
jgi:hypothetical protein